MAFERACSQFLFFLISLSIFHGVLSTEIDSKGEYVISIAQQKQKIEIYPFIFHLGSLSYSNVYVELQYR